MKFGTDDDTDPIAERQPFVPETLSGDSRQNDLEYDSANIDYDVASGTKVGCVIAVTVGTIFAMVCLVLGIFILHANPSTLAAQLAVSSISREFIGLAINIVLTLITDGMMYVHSVSLRWALYRETRLEFNTNIRLFTSAKKSWPNKWYSNAMALFCLVLTYGASSVLLVDNGFDPMPSPEEPTGSIPESEQVISGTALISLGLGLAGQAAIAIGCLLSARNTIPSWSSNPLNNALVAMRQEQIEHRSGRCMMSVHQRHQWTNQEVYPEKKQRNMFQAQGTVRYILTLLWILALLALAWPITVAVVSMSIGNASASAWQEVPVSCWKMGFEWDMDYSPCERNIVTLSMSPLENDHKPTSVLFSYPTEAVLSVLFVCLIQAAQTVALHCTELLVNLSRDEAVWRRAYIRKTGKGTGTQKSSNPFRAALTSWENMVLFVAKALLHWIIAQGMLAHIDATMGHYDEITESVFENRRPTMDFNMIYPRLFIYSILAILLATFATFLALRRRNGCQPASMGHLQTLVDLIDEWETDEKGRMWWGDKTTLEVASSENDVRHAGTSPRAEMLGLIRLNARYAGSRRNFIKEQIQ